eukprot:768822-Hanusia_phi.AAC.2
MPFEILTTRHGLRGNERNSTPRGGLFKGSVDSTARPLCLLPRSESYTLPEPLLNLEQEPAAPSEVCEDLTFHGTDYIVEVSANESNVLTVDVEKKDDGERWHGEFSASYIEEVTQKTGNFKKFSVFYKMLCSALKQACDVVERERLMLSAALRPARLSSRIC